jgi:hypothetical protein
MIGYKQAGDQDPMLNRRMKWACLAVIPILLAWMNGISLSAQKLNSQVELSPANPTSNDVITYKLTGTWQNGCVPQSPSVSISTGVVRIHTSNSHAVCTQALTPWTLTGSIGVLASGNYSLIADYSGPSASSTIEIIRKTFSVTPSLKANELILPVVVNGISAEQLFYQSIFTILNTTNTTIDATLQVYSNDGTPGGIFCSPLAPPPSKMTATLKPGAQLFRFTSADLPFHNGWARLTWAGPSTLLASEELSLVAATPEPCLLICKQPSTVKISSMQISSMKSGQEFQLPVTLNSYRQTGLALINPSETQKIDIRLSIFDEAGAPAKLGVPNTFDLQIGPLQRISKFLWQMALDHSPLTAILPVPSDFQGSVVLTSDRPFAVGAVNIMEPEGKMVSIPVFAGSR